MRRIEPKSIADSLVQKGSRLARLYGLPKTHKEKLAMRPILSATGTYNYKLVKWLDEKLKPLSTTDEHTIGDIFSFADDLKEMEIRPSPFFSLFTVVRPTQIFAFSKKKSYEEGNDIFDWFISLA